MNRSKKKRNQIAILYCLFFLGIISWMFITKYYDSGNEFKLKKHHLFTSGHIKSIMPPGRSSGYIIYYYYVNGKYFDNSYHDFNYNNSYKYLSLVDSNFNVIYQPEDPSNSAILLKKNDYEKYDIPLDSIGKVIDFY